MHNDACIWDSQEKRRGVGGMGNSVKGLKGIIP